MTPYLLGFWLIVNFFNADSAHSSAHNVCNIRTKIQYVSNGVQINGKTLDQRPFTIGES